MASLPQLPYDDSTPFFAARQIPGCFTAAQVLRSLGQPLGPADHEVEPVKAPVQMIGKDLDGCDNHFLPGCACSPLHAQCGDLKPQAGMGCKVSFTPEQLRVAAEAGCLFCRAIYGGIRAAPPWDPSRKTPTPMLPSIELNSARWEGQDAGIMLFQPRDPPIMIYVDERSANRSPCRMFRVRGDLESTTDAQDMISYIRRFNQDCHDHHSCSPPDASFRPTRLVQVDVKDEKYAVKLVQGVQLTTVSHYLTLSHCWGTNMPSSAKTLVSTLEHNLISIPWEGLTQTFRDAAAMTERLGYSHIWIDSLCIIQDSKADWEAEAAMMGEVYANCDLMLSADGAPNGSVGFFRSAQISSRPWKPQGVQGTALDAVRFAYIKYHRTFGQMVQMFVSPEEWAHLCPLDSRAWCYQERRLAPRIIHFGMDELHWDCQRGGLCQCGVFGDLPFPTDRAQMHKAVAALVFKKVDKELLWDQAITGYSERNLTQWTDRLPALSGLAKRFLPRRLNPTTTLPITQEEEGLPFDEVDLGCYLAGLWSGSLSRGLCWWAHYRPGMRISSPPGRYIAPSWSWMSVSGQVQVIAPADFEPVAKVLSADCVPHTMGAISYGEVVLRAKVIRLSAFRGVVGDRQRMVYIHVECADPQDLAKQVSPGTFRPDAAPQFNDDLADASFFAGSNSYLADPNVKGKDLEPLKDDGTYFGVHMAKMFIMVVKPVASGENNTYERVGSVFLSGFRAEKSDKSRFFEGVEATVIKLV